MSSPTNPIYETTKDMFNQLKAQGAARYTMLAVVLMVYSGAFSFGYLLLL